jgi:hypothetical protein
LICEVLKIYFFQLLNAIYPLILQIFAEKPAVRRAYLDYVPKKVTPIYIINILAWTVENSGMKFS